MKIKTNHGNIVSISESLKSFTEEELKAIETDTSHILKVCTMEEKEKKIRTSIIYKITGIKYKE
ncbi:MAG: hypothetical protein PHF86_01685 [Candidatus Nanoarchaeia archaeon]|nr:hypothetical protein [Candidatus Nanoarchaeia archaeon]